VNDATRWGFRGDFQGGTKGRRHAIRPSPSPLEPPLEVLETFGGAKVSDDDQLKTERVNHFYSLSQIHLKKELFYASPDFVKNALHL
jgi:hypothetical protein